MKEGKTHLRLYITENAPHSNRAIVNLKALCDQMISQDVDYEILDVHKHADLAMKDHIQVAPTLLKTGEPFRISGDLSNHETVKKELRLVAVKSRGADAEFNRVAKTKKNNSCS